MKYSSSQESVEELRQLDPGSWAELLRPLPGLEHVVVTKVTGETRDNQTTRYLLTLAGQNDPITFLGKRTNVREAAFYRRLSQDVPFIAPRAYFTYSDRTSGWVVVGDVPNDRPPVDWQAGDVADIVTALADLHVCYWGQRSGLLSNRWLPYYLGTRRRKGRTQSQLDAWDWDSADISEQALQTTQDLAPLWRKASAGLRTMLELEGWQGVIEEKHLRAAADLIDDPLPLLHPLRNAPPTLLHGYPGLYNWRVSGLGAHHLVDWQNVSIGPGVCDLAAFLETFGLLQEPDMTYAVRETWPVSEETIVDTYILRLSSELGAAVDAREVRRTLPAARCLYILLHWFPRFDRWFSELPRNQGARRDIWRAISEYDEEDLEQTVYRPIAGLRPYLAETFNRFIRAYHQIT